ncbi:hypothetical protein [Geosporobacter ferrireducens]|uniref:Uncharacterized protein n=1 Tax=Geosporobacter ferrireducens TaxID=1424294 RepID=A0A1D8GGC0_9FIRM|nr:hypothetical protein [Geosporobacter ferrireducens]AOT69949.1 hypothetical protein Gferi_10345 [Geosporobacter ferrireducens]
MKINKIDYPVPLSNIADIENDNIDVFIELDDGFQYNMLVVTPQNLNWLMDKENMNYLPAGVPFIVVKTLTEENIRNAIESYLEDDGYWLKLYQLAGERFGLLSIKEMDEMLLKLKKENEELYKE